MPALPLVSIITPTYNHERFIGACIQSVLAQDYSQWEMVVIDDGSSDRTWEIIQRFARQDGRIRAFRQPNKGVWRLAETYNFALEQSRGELIAVLEGDDLWPERKLSTQVNAHLSGDLCLSFGQMKLVDASGMVLPAQAYPDVKGHPYLGKEASFNVFRRFLRGEFSMPAVTLIFNKKALMGIGGFIQPTYLPVVDYPTCVTLAAAESRIEFIPQVLGFWRRYPGQTTTLLADNMFIGVYRFSWEFAEGHKVDLGVPVDELGLYLMSPKRQSFLALGIYQLAAKAFERGDTKQAWAYCRHIAGLGFQYSSLFLLSLLVFAWKSSRRLLKMG